jgi:predicted XRE-type DNA-binding protein
MTVPRELPGPNSGVHASIIAHATDGQPAYLQLRLHLMVAACRAMRQKRIRQRDGAVLFGVTQPRVSDLVRGKAALSSLDTLVGMLAALGVTVTFQLRAHHTTATVRQAAAPVRSSRSRRQRRDAESGSGE